MANNIIQLNDFLYCLEVPKDAKNEYIVDVLDVYTLVYKAFGDEPCARIIGFKSKTLGYVEKDFISFDTTNYVGEEPIPDVRFYKLLSDNGILFTNPMGEFEPLPLDYIDIDNWKMDLQRHQIFESKKVNSASKILIIEKI